MSQSRPGLGDARMSQARSELRTYTARVEIDGQERQRTLPGARSVSSASVIAAHAAVETLRDYPDAKSVLIEVETAD